MKKDILVMLVIAFLSVVTLLIVQNCSSPTDSGEKYGCGDGSGQGACSTHDGVDCSAGKDSDGSVICNDGWRNSTVSYCDACE